MMRSRETHHVKWTQDEWSRLIAAALPVCKAERIGLHDALTKVQSKVLPRERMRKAPVIYVSLRTERVKTLIRSVAQCVTPPPPPDLSSLALATPSAQARAQGAPLSFLPPLPPLPTLPNRIAQATPEGTKALRATYQAGATWTPREWAEVTRYADALIDEKLVSSYIRAVTEAQDVVLPVSRRRTLFGLQKAYYHARPAFDRHLEAARAYVRSVSAQAASAAPAMPDAPGASVSPIAAAAPVVQAPNTPDAPTVQASQSSQHSQAPEPSRGDFPVPTVAPAALRFATSIAYAVDSLLTEQSQSIVGQLQAMLHATLDARMGAMAQAMAGDITQRVCSQVAQDIQGNLARVVHALMEHELGPVAAPSVDGPEAAPVPLANVNGDATPGDARHFMTNGQPRDDMGRPERIPVDVIGLLPAQANIVAEEFKATPHLDLRFLETDKVRAHTLRKHVISVTKFGTHANERRAEKHGADLIRVNGTQQSVIAAVHQLMQSYARPQTAQAAAAVH